MSPEEQPQNFLAWDSAPSGRYSIPDHWSGYKGDECRAKKEKTFTFHFRVGWPKKAKHCLLEVNFTRFKITHFKMILRGGSAIVEKRAPEGGNKAVLRRCKQKHPFVNGTFKKPQLPQFSICFGPCPILLSLLFPIQLA